MAQRQKQLKVQLKRFRPLCCGLALGGISVLAPAAEFFTIIGPDGRPMVVQQRPDQKVKEKEAKKEVKKVEITQNDQSAHSSIQQQSNVNDLPKVEVAAPLKQAEPLEKPISKSSVQENPRTEKSDRVEQFPLNQKIKTDTKGIKTPPKQSAAKQSAIEKPTQITKPVQVNDAQKKVEKRESVNVVDIEQSKENRKQLQKKVQPLVIEKPTISSDQLDPTQSEVAVKQQKTQISHQNQVNQTDQTTKPHQSITVIDGVQYVDNEYLEDKEFNLEGRKRFYVMPDSSIAGSSRFETVEREKGITKSVFSKFLKNTPTQLAPVVLAPTYYRLPKDEVVQNLEQACFSGKKLEKAKELSPNNMEMGIWPVPPIKEKFVYDVVKLDSQVENIHFSSYASSQKNPSYYWPLVVFLDQKGCVIEGVSGFKNQDTEANNLKYSALEGVLKKPNQAMYLFMTPLAESIDVQHVQLSNKGQIKLSVLR